MTEAVDIDNDTNDDMYQLSIMLGAEMFSA